MLYDNLLVTVIEHPSYLRAANKILTRNELDQVADYLAANPDSGDLIKGTGGCRKLRFSTENNKGKSGGARVIHVFLKADQEVHLVDIYLKGTKSNLSKSEINQLAKLTAVLKG